MDYGKGTTSQKYYYIVDMVLMWITVCFGLVWFGILNYSQKKEKPQWNNTEISFNLF